MILLIIFLLCLFITVGTGLLSAWSDFNGLIIPNGHSIAIIMAFIVAFGACALLGHNHVFAPLLSHIISAVVVLGVTMVMFFLGGLGAGDSKLATAFALWAGLKGLVSFLFFMSIFGGILGISALLLKKYTPIKDPKDGTWIAHVQAGESKVPYGIAITAGALVSFANLGYFNIETFVSFLN